MAHKFEAAARKKLDGEERRRLLAPAETLAKLGFQKGDTLADIGCGTGLFTLPAARLTSPNAKIYALDISQIMLNEVVSRAQKDDIRNIVAVPSEEYDCKLADETADFVLLCTVLHEVDDKKRLLAEAARICRTGGTVAVIEFAETRADLGPPLCHRLPEAHVKKLLENAGLSSAESWKISEAFYAVAAKKHGQDGR